jgi:lantibiotic biosynthesis protein
MNFPYYFHDQLVLRAPQCSLTQAINPPALLQILQHPPFLEAIYIASPILYSTCIKYKEGLLTNPKDVEKLTHAVVKYYTRMSSRCTPFGLFSGCGLVSWQQGNTHVVINNKPIKRHTRLDMHFLCALVQKITTHPEVKERLHYFSNNSIYTIGNEIRYVEYSYEEGKRKYQITAIKKNECVTDVLAMANKGISYAQLFQYLHIPNKHAEEVEVS